MVGAHLPLMWEWEDVRMKLLLLSLVGVMAAERGTGQLSPPAPFGKSEVRFAMKQLGWIA